MPIGKQVRQNRRRGLATRLFLSQVEYLVHDNLDVLMLGTVLVGPGVRVKLSGEEDFLTLLEKVPRDGLLVVVEFLLEDYATRPLPPVPARQPSNSRNSENSFPQGIHR